MPFREDKRKSALDDAQAARSFIQAAAGRIAGMTTDPRILREVDTILAAAQRQKDYIMAARRLAELEARVA